jgi:Domain of unknown function (DUF5916)/Carbohydrate family 9 binding domain-like
MNGPARWFRVGLVAISLCAAGLPQIAHAQLQARRVTTPPVIDGRDDDAAWRDVPSETQFVAFRPTEGAAPTYRTEVRATFDDHALYVLVRSYDPRPDSIIALLARRDNLAPPSDLIQLYVDSYHDRRNGYEFAVNPAGVKTDLLLFDDDRSDISWNAIWDVATRVDSLGWVAEFAIPFSQMRFRGGPQTAFGLMVVRTIGRLGEQESWPQFRPSRAGVVSQLGTLEGLVQLPTGARMETTPYVLASGANTARATGVPVRTETRMSGGADVKFAPTPSVTVDGTFNPDFGQVEADPAVLNLTSVETFYPEQRPFFLEGAGLFRFTLSRDPASNESLFYTRRIGRRPQLADLYGNASTEQQTTILGAGKVTGRFGSGFSSVSVASLSALTDQELGAPRPSALGGGRYVVEPRTFYDATRVNRAFRGGRSGVGLMVTAVERDVDSLTGSLLPRQALTAGFATQNQSSDGQYWMRFWAATSDLRGTTDAITRVQLSPIHAFQRPDDHNVLDTTRTELSGSAAQLWIGKTGGVTRYGTSYRYFSPGFDPTDLGFINEANHRSWVVDAGLQSTHATRFYRNANVQLLHIVWWSGPGRIDDMLNLVSNVELPSQWRVQLSTGANQLGGTICSQHCTRGGPAVRKDPLTFAQVDVLGDSRHTLTPEIPIIWQSDDGGRSHTWTVTPTVLWRAASNLSVSLNAGFQELINDTQFYAAFGSPFSDTTHYTVAHLAQSTRAITTRISYAATPALSVQWYAQPFVSRGAFSNVRELNEPRAAAFALRYRPYGDTVVTGSPGGVNFQQFRSNFVTRWEYRPGSVLYVVWSQGRDIFTNEAGTLQLSRDARDLFALQPRNTIAVKASYWYGR